MTYRITKKQVEDRIATLNRLLGLEDPDYSTVGMIRLGSAYEGYRVEMVCNEYGGVSALSQCGYHTLHHANDFVAGMIAGAHAVKRAAEGE